jgi:hypothetical protein
VLYASVFFYIYQYYYITPNDRRLIFSLATHVVQNLHLVLDLMTVTKEQRELTVFKFGTEVNYKYM